jgi:hypothetical protein
MAKPVNFVLIEPANRAKRVKPPLEHYHGVPPGWSADEMSAFHASLKGTHPLIDPRAAKAPKHWQDHRSRHRLSLHRVDQGIRLGDEACVEIAVRYIELRYMGSCTGYIRGGLARRLKSAVLTNHQQTRLNQHFLKLVVERDYSFEFREYRTLWSRIIDARFLDAVLTHLQLSANSARLGGGWLMNLIIAYERRQLKPQPTPRPIRCRN